MDPVLDSVVYIIPQAGGWLSDAAGVLAALAATFSTLVAVIALRHTQRQMALQKQHNILMVTPHLSTDTALSIASNSFTYTINNNGIGPAIIKRVTIYAYGKTYENDITKAIKENCQELPLKHFGTVGSGSYTVGEFVPAGNSQTILKASETKHPLREARTAFFANYRIVIEYECIYKNQFIYDSDDYKSYA
nr:hypothetical protein [Pseudomonas sp.]